MTPTLIDRYNTNWRPRMSSKRKRRRPPVLASSPPSEGEKEGLPTEEEFKDLGAVAVVAFAARCARCVQPLFEIYCPDSPEGHFQAIEEAVEAAEGGASFDAWDIGRFPDQYAKAAASVAADVMGVSVHAAAIASAASAAVQAVRNSDCVTWAVRAAGYAAEGAQVPSAVRYIRRDFNRLLEGEQRGEFELAEHISPSIFGEPWLIEPPGGRIAGRLTREISPTAELEGMFEVIEAAILSIRKRFRRFLGSLEGVSLETFEENQRLAATIQEVAKRLHVALICPRCGHLSRLRCLRSGRSKAGTFQFDHVIDGRRTHHGGTAALPRLKVVPLPLLPQQSETAPNSSED